MSQFTLTAVEPDPRFWDGEHGRFAIYTVEFEGSQGKGTAEVKQKASTAPPAPGQTIDAEIVQKAGRPAELKKIFQGSQNGKGASRSPEERKSIIRQHSQEMAIRWVQIMQLRGKVPDDADTAFLKKLVDWFQADAEGGGQ